MSLKQKLFYLTLLLSLINFLIAAFLGILLRVQPLVQIEGLIPRFVVHAHSHVAFLGWVFLALLAFIYKYWFSECRKVALQYLVLLGIFQISVLGMLVTFPFTGYALWSIIFSTLHMAASLYFIFFFERKSLGSGVYGKRFVRAGLYFMALSSLGPLALGPLVATGHKMDLWYNLAIYFYLHFQYNGWFTMLILGLIVNQLPTITAKKNAQNINTAFWWFVPGIILTYFLSALGYKISVGMNFLGGVGAILQLIGFYKLLPVFKRTVRLEFHNSFKKFLVIVLLLLFGKIAGQFLSAFPTLVDFTYYNRDFIIAYLHWVLLGFVSLFLIYSLSKEINSTPFEKPKAGWMWVFFLAFIALEIILVSRGVLAGKISRTWILYSDLFLLADALLLAFTVFAIFLRLLNFLKREIYTT